MCYALSSSNFFSTVVETVSLLPVPEIKFIAIRMFLRDYRAQFVFVLLSAD